MDVINVCRDGSVRKAVKRTGHGIVPLRGDKVTVHYRGRVVDRDDVDDDDGGSVLSTAGAGDSAAAWVSDAFVTYFDDSFARGSPLTVTLGFDPLISGWTEALATMQAGERAVVTISPEKGYGANGKPPSIPPSATLVFDLEVLSINQATATTTPATATTASQGTTSSPANNGGGGPIHTKASPKPSKEPQLKDVSGGDGAVRRYLPLGSLMGRAAPADQTPDDLSEVACEVLMFQQLPPHKRKQQRETVTAAATATATAGGEVAEAIDGGGSSKETKLKLQAEKLIAVRAVASFSVDDNADSHWEAMDWCVKQLGKGDTGDFLVAAPYAIQLFSDHDDGTGGEEKTAAVATTAAAVATVTGAAAAAEGIGKGKGERGKVAKLLCEDGKKLFKAYEVCEEGALECDAAAAEAAVRAIAFAKSLSTSTSSSTQTSETAVPAVPAVPAVTAAGAGAGAGAGAAATTAATATAATTKTLEADTAPPLVFVRIKVVGVDKLCNGRQTLTKDMSVAEKLVRAGELREAGNGYFKNNGDYARAGRRYSAALNLISLDQGYSLAERRAVRAEGLLCFLNRAQCALKRGQWKGAKRDSQCAAGIDPENVKALFRKGLALVGLEEWEAAKVDLEKVVAKEPSNSSALRALKKAKAECRKQDLESRKVFEGAFVAAEKEAVATTTTNTANDNEKSKIRNSSSTDQAAAKTTTMTTATTSNKSTSNRSDGTKKKGVSPKKKGLLLYDDKPTVKPLKKKVGNNNDINEDADDNDNDDDDEEDDAFVKFEATVPAGVKAGDSFPFELTPLKKMTQPSDHSSSSSSSSSFLARLMGGLLTETKAEVMVTVPVGSEEGDKIDVRVKKTELTIDFGGSKENKEGDGSSNTNVNRNDENGYEDDEDDEPLSGPVGGGLVRPSTSTWVFVLSGAVSLLAASSIGRYARRNFTPGTNGGGSGDLVVISYLGCMLLIAGLAGLADKKFAKSQMCEMWCSMAFAMCLPSALSSLVWGTTSLLKAPAIMLIAKSTHGGMWSNMVPTFGPFGNAPNVRRKFKMRVKEPKKVILAVVTIFLTFHLSPFLSTLRKGLEEAIENTHMRLRSFSRSSQQKKDNASNTQGHKGSADDEKDKGGNSDSSSDDDDDDDNNDRGPTQLDGQTANGRHAKKLGGAEKEPIRAASSNEA